MSDANKTSKSQEPIILGLEASGEHASVAVISGSTLLAMRRLDQRHGHASHFTQLAKECLDEAGLIFQDITAIAAGVGPGSFTGLRVCLSAAKGFALAGALPALGVNGLRARAFAANAAKQMIKGPQQAFIACADTRRGVLFHQMFDASFTAMSAITESPLDSLVMAHKEALLCLPPLDDIDQYDLPDNARIVPMTAQHIAQLAAHDYRLCQAQGKALPALDPLYVAAPKLGPAKTVQAPSS